MNYHSYAPLRRALAANAAFSLITGSVLAIASASVAPLVSVNASPWIFAVIGAGLLLFGVFVAWLANRPAPDPLLALAVSIGDLTWVIGTAILLAVANGTLKLVGMAAMSLVAVCVLGFAIGQLRGISRLYVKDGDSRFRVCLDIHSRGSEMAIWRNLANLGAISRFAPSLASSSLRSGTEPAVGCIRDCVDKGGRSWSERCTSIDHEKRTLVMEFLAKEPGFPFPFVEMSGGWSVREGARGTVVKVWWEGTPKFPLLNALILPLLSWQARRQFPAVVSAMSGESNMVNQRPLHPVIAPC